MDQDLFNLVAAAARARCLTAGLAIAGDELTPPHPAFAGFRRITYLWEEGLTSFPVGDTAEVWIDFLRERECSDATLNLGRGGDSLLVSHPGGADAWSAGSLEGAPLLRGSASVSTAPEQQPSPAVAASQLRAVADAASAHVSSPVERDSLRRAVAILDADGDGSEASDVAWPYFVLPQQAGDAARRLFAAAAAVSQAGSVDPAVAAACRVSIASAVNGIGRS